MLPRSSDYYFQINQDGWTRILYVTATTKDENSPDRLVGYFRIKDIYNEEYT